jgi:DNA polymerase alpha subunit B
LEGSRLISGGARVEVDLSYMKSNKIPYSLFPGQVVAIEGMNCSGRKLVAQRICEGTPRNPEQSAVADIIKYHYGDNFQSGAPLKIVVASGPFTCADNLEYEPLVDLVSTVVMKFRPDVVILSGPFVDMNQASVTSGETLLSTENNDEKLLLPYESIFLEKISGLLEELYLSDNTLQTQFVLVPSLDDATIESVYPQAPFQKSNPRQLKVPGADKVFIGSLGLHSIENANRIPGIAHPRRIHCVSNPCTFKINEVVFGISSTDVLFHISADETNANLEIGTRMSRIAQHLLQQRSYYPLFPASSTTNLNLKYMDKWQMPCAPDVLILPSKLSPFCSGLLDNSTVVVNPGHLARSNMGGTYAVMDIYPIARDVLDNAGGDDVQLKHNIHDRTYIEIKRI